MNKLPLRGRVVSLEVVLVGNKGGRAEAPLSGGSGPPNQSPWPTDLDLPPVLSLVILESIFKNYKPKVPQGKQI